MKTCRYCGTEVEEYSLIYGICPTCATNVPYNSTNEPTKQESIDTNQNDESTTAAINAMNTVIQNNINTSSI